MAKIAARVGVEDKENALIADDSCGAQAAGKDGLDHVAAVAGILDIGAKVTFCDKSPSSPDSGQHSAPGIP